MSRPRDGAGRGLEPCSPAGRGHTLEPVWVEPLQRSHLAYDLASFIGLFNQ